MKGPSSATLLALLGVAGLLPHNSVALPADHSSTTPPDPIHYNDTTSSSLQGTLQQTSQKRVFDTISITECMTKPGWWLACCNHPVSSKHGARGECRDYADRSLKLDKIGSCENDGSGHGDLDHGPYCPFDSYYPSGGPGLIKEGPNGRETEAAQKILMDYIDGKFAETNQTETTELDYKHQIKQCNAKYWPDKHARPRDNARKLYESCVENAQN